MERYKEIKWKTVSDLPIDNWRKLAKLFIKEKECFEKNKKSFGGCPLYRIIVFNSRTKVFAPHFIIKANKLGDYYYTGYYDKSGNAVVNEKESHCFSLELLSNCKDIYLVKEENMETKETEIKINVPDGYEIDKENSTFECIKFKKKDVSWRSTETDGSNYINKMSGYTIGVGSELLEIKNWLHTKFNRFLFATEKQAKSALAMAQISQIMANDERFGGVVKELDFGNTCAKRFWQIQRIKLKSEKPYIAINQVDASYNYSVLTFYKLEQAVLFLEENEDLVKDYLMID